MGRTPVGPTSEGRRTAARRLVVLVLGLAALLTGALVATAATSGTSTATASATTMAVTPSSDYTRLEVTLSEPLYGNATKGALPPGSFTVETTSSTGVTTTATPTFTASGTAGTGYALTLTAAATPNLSKVVLANAYVGGGTAAGRVEQVVALVAADAAQQVAGLAGLKVDLRRFGPLPFVGTWFRNEQQVTNSPTAKAGLQALAAVAEPDPSPAGTGATTPAPASATVAMEARTRTLADLLPTLQAELTSAAEAGGGQADVVKALQRVPGIGDVTFTPGAVEITLDPKENARSVSATQTTTLATPPDAPAGRPVLPPYSVRGATSVDLALSGRVRLTTAAAGARGVLDLIDLDVLPSGFDLPDDDTRIGMVGVQPVQRADVSGLTASYDCEAGCSATPTATLKGSVALVVDTVTVEDGDDDATYDLRIGTAGMRATWTTDAWNLAGLQALKTEEGEAAEKLLAPLRPVVTGDAKYWEQHLEQFDRLDSRAFVMGLEWVGNWLRSTDAVEALGTRIPVLDMTVGDALQLSDQVGARVTTLVDALEGTGATPLAEDPTVQDLMDLLCTQGLVDCDSGILDALRVTPDGVTYDVDLDVCQALFGDKSACDTDRAVTTQTGVDVTKAGPSLNLAAGDALDLDAADDADLGALDGVSASLRTGTWKGRASARLAFRLKLDLRDDADVAPGVTPEQYPGPGFPATDRLAEDDLCRLLALSLGTGYSPNSFAQVNGALLDALPTDGCDELAWDAAGSLTTVKLPVPDGAPTGTLPATYKVTAADVCRAVARKHELELPGFLALNPGLGTGDAAAGACAARARTHVRATPAALATLPAFTYYMPDPKAPLPVSYRLSVERLDAGTPLADATVEVDGQDLGADVQLGFLDLALDGTVAAAPTVSMDLVDGKALTLVDLARAADDASPTVTIGKLVNATLGGTLSFDATLVNDLAFPADDPAAFQLRGDLAELTGGGDITAFDDCADLDALGDDATGLCYELGSWTDLKGMTPAQALRMVTGLIDRVAGMAGSGAGSFELPLVGVSVQDLIGFNRKLHDFADAVESRDPQSLTALQDAIDEGLVGAGLPPGSVTAEMNGHVLELAIPMTVQETATYPFSFDLGLDALPVRIAPSDGGARVTATGRASFTPTLGIDLSAGITELEDAIFLVVDEDDDPTVGGTLSGEVAGDITFGPLAVAMSGSVAGSPEATLQLSTLGNSKGRLTSSRLAQLLDGNKRTAADTALLKGLFSWGGDLEVKAEIAVPGVDPLTLLWDADLNKLVTEKGYRGEFAEGGDPREWELPKLELDLGTLVRGTSQTSRFVGRALANSEALSTELPVVGDELAKLASVGADLQTFATTVDDLWQQADEEQAAFVADVNATLDDTVCAALADVGDCSAALYVYDDVDSTEAQPADEVDLLTARKVELQLLLEKEVTKTTATDKLLDVPGFEIDTDAALKVTAGYRVGLTLGLDAENGFYVKGFDPKGDPEAAAGSSPALDEVSRLLELYGNASIKTGTGGNTALPAASSGVKVGGVTVFTLDKLDLTLGGTLGPDGDSAGFALDMPTALTLADLGSGRRGVDEMLSPQISVATDATIVLGTPTDIADELPVLKFPVLFSWGVEGQLGRGLEVPLPSLSIGKRDDPKTTVDDGVYVTLDVTAFVDGVVRPALLELNKYNPIAQAKPVKEALKTDIPVLDQNVRALLDSALGSDPRWQLFTFLLDLDDVANSLADAPKTAVIVPLGGYEVLPRSPQPFFKPTSYATLWERPELALIKDLVGKLSAAAGGSRTFTPPPAQRTPTPPGTAAPTTRRTSSTTFQGKPAKKPTFGEVVKFPILNDPMSAATLLFGGEAEPVSFIEIAPPPVDFGMSIKFERTLFDLDVAFLQAKLSVGLEGAVGVVLRVGIGYSSHGLTTGDPLDGLYLVDAYDGERSLPFVALGGRVSAHVDGRFAVAGIAEATFSGSGYVRLEGGLDLFDESLAIPEEGRGDGKFHVDEMARVVDGHRISGPDKSAADFFCIFRPTVQLYAGLNFSGTARLAGIEVWSGSYGNDWELVNKTWACPSAPRIAHLDEERRLVLNAGTYVLDSLDDTRSASGAEGFDITLKGDSLVVRGVGGDMARYPEMTFPLDAVDEVFAELGAGDDTVTVGAGVTVPLKLFGGLGNDTLNGGDVDDEIDAGAGTDKVTPGAGDDDVVIGAEPLTGAAVTAGNGLGRCETGCDVVVLDGGDDVVHGGPSPVVYQPVGDYGDDRVEHIGTSAVVDFGRSSLPVDGVVDSLGASFVSTRGTDPVGTLVVDDPTTLARVLGSSGGDALRIADGPLGMYVDGAQGADTVTVETNGNDRTVRVHDYGSALTADQLRSRTATCTAAATTAAAAQQETVALGDCLAADRLVVRGTAGADRILLRARSTGSDTAPADEGVVAVLSPESSASATVNIKQPTPEKGKKPQVTYRYEGVAKATQMVKYDSTLEGLSVQGVAGEDEYGLDDVATNTTVEGGRGGAAGETGSSFQVGQLYGWETDTITPATTAGAAATRTPAASARPVTPWDDVSSFRYRPSIRGWLSYGTSHPTTVRGGLSDDQYTVYSNRAPLTLEGVGGDDTFTLRAFIANGSIRAAGGDGDDAFQYDFDYVANDAVKIDGGNGFNTYVAIGTELQDGFNVTSAGVSICRPKGNAPGVGDLADRVARGPGINALPLQPVVGGPVPLFGACAIQSSVQRVQRYVLYGLQGNDVFWVKGAPAGTETFLIGGRDGSTYLVGDRGDLSKVAGTIEVVADLRNLSPAAEVALRSVDLDFPVPLLLDGEVAYSAVDALLPADAVDLTAEHTAVVDASAMTTPLTGTMSRDAAATATAGIRLTGLGLPEPGSDLKLGDGRPYKIAGGIGARGLDNLRVVLGKDSDDLTVAGTQSAYEEHLDDPLRKTVRKGRTELYAGTDNDTMRINAVDGPTWVDLEEGADKALVGSVKRSVSQVRQQLEVLGGDGADLLEVDAGAADQRLRADLDRKDLLSGWTARGPVTMGLLTGLDLPSGGYVQHDEAVDVLRVQTAGFADVVNVRGTVAGTSTELRTAGGDDDVFVSQLAEQPLARAGISPVVPGLLLGSLSSAATPTTAAKGVLRPLDVEAGAGSNLLMVSDRASTTGRTVALTTERDVSASPTVVMKKGGIDVSGAGRISYDALDKGTFARGVTTWLGSGNDQVSVTGTRNDGFDPGVLAWDTVRPVQAPRTTTTLNTGAGADRVDTSLPSESGPFVLNLEAGDDRLADGTLPDGKLVGGTNAGRIVAFGGDGADVLQTGSGDDLAFGDFGVVDYGPAGVLGVPTAMDRVPVRAAAPTKVTSCTAQATVSTAGAVGGCELPAVPAVSGVLSYGGASVRNLLSLGAGDDVGIGGGGSDWIDDAAGTNVLVGDHGSVRRVASSALGGKRQITGGGGGFVAVTVLEGPFVYVVDVLDTLGGSADVVLGGTDRDQVFAGRGDDLVNGRPGSDLVFGGDGLDALWGGTGDDRVYAGAGADLVDLKSGIGAGKRAEYRDGWPIGNWWAGKPLVAPADWAARPVVGTAPAWPGLVSREDTDMDAGSINGSDVVFGGDGPDAMQADVGGAGKLPGDRLVDWHGAYNVFFVCQGAYGAGYVQRASSPAMVSGFQQMAVADGAFGASGLAQLAVPGGGNTSPTHPAHPGNNHGC